MLKPYGIVPTFYENMFKGNSVKELIKILLEKSWYTVFPYGYESNISDVKKKLRRVYSGTALRIRSSPDLLVYDDRINDAMLAEVKTRKTDSETRVFLKIESCKEFWDDSYIIVAVPCCGVFYAQRVSELENKDEFILAKEFVRLEDVFTRIELKNLKYYKDLACKLLAIS